MIETEVAVEHEAAAERVGRLGHQVAVRGDHLGRAVAAPQEHAAEHGRADRPQGELELDDDAERGVAAAERPEEVGVLGRRGGDDAAGGDQDARGAQVVARQPEPPLEPAAAGAEDGVDDGRVGQSGRR